jgi:hypothetical protein
MQDLDEYDWSYFHKSSIDMAHTLTFTVSSKDESISLIQDARAEYCGKGKYAGESILLIEVFGYNHHEEATKLYNALKEAGVVDRYQHIRIETN